MQQEFDSIKAAILGLEAPASQAAAYELLVAEEWLEAAASDVGSLWADEETKDRAQALLDRFGRRPEFYVSPRPAHEILPRTMTAGCC